MRKAIDNNSGFVLPLVLIVIALLASGVSYILAQGIDELHANRKNQDYAICMLVGKNAIEIAKAEIEDNINYSGTNGKICDENGGVYQIVVYKITENSRCVEVISEYNENRKKFDGQIELVPKPDAFPKGSITTFDWKMKEEF